MPVANTLGYEGVTGTCLMDMVQRMYRKMKEQSV